MTTEGKTIPNKKIVRAAPGESNRNYKNKPKEERIGSRNQKGSKKIFQHYEPGKEARDTRNGKDGLKKITLYANGDPLGNWHAKKAFKHQSFEHGFTRTYEPLYKKMKKTIPVDKTVDGVTYETSKYQ